MRLLRFAGLALALALAPIVLLPAYPAAAHGGKVKLDVAGDGATGVTVRAIYGDGHPVDDITLRLVLTATGEGGRSVGPLQLTPAGEGRGFYASTGILAPGRWRVTVTAPAPHSARTVVTIDATARQSARSVATVQAAPPGQGGRASWIWWAIAAGTAALTAVVFATVAHTVRRHATR